MTTPTPAELAGLLADFLARDGSPAVHGITVDGDGMTFATRQLDMGDGDLEHPETVLLGALVESDGPLRGTDAVAIVTTGKARDMTDPDAPAIPVGVAYVAHRDGHAASRVTNRATGADLTPPGAPVGGDLAGLVARLLAGVVMSIEEVDAWRDSRDAVAAGNMPDPYPVGTSCRIVDHDGTMIPTTYRVVRSYWPSPVVEVVDVADLERGMIRQGHDRMRPLSSSDAY